MLTTKQFFGEPINCDVHEKERKDVINTFCWIYGTFVSKESQNSATLPGLGIDVSDNPSAITRQTYYQWVCISFCVQALIFYLPRYLWKIWEGGRLRLLLSDLTGPLITPNWNDATKDKLIKYMLNGRIVHSIYVTRYCLCESLNFINVIAQICFLDWFITGNFSIYGIAYATYDLINPMNSVFPKITKCTYYRYGPSGTIENRDALCILPLNILNEKVFLVLWYWLCILLILSFFSLVYRALFLFVSKFRVYLLRLQVRDLDKKNVKLVVDHITAGDFFVLHQISKNVNPIMFKELVVGIHDTIKNEKLLAMNLMKNLHTEEV